MDTLNAILREEVEKYAGSGRGGNILLFPVLDDQRQIYAVNSVYFPDRKEAATVVVMARLIGETIVIEEDSTDRPLVDALRQRGVPRDKIILAYAGEPIPDADTYRLSQA